MQENANIDFKVAAAGMWQQSHHPLNFFVYNTVTLNVDIAKRSKNKTAHLYL